MSKLSSDELAHVEQSRLQALHDYHILDTAPELSFDDLAALASQVCDTPVALVTLVDADRNWFKAKVGTQISMVPRGLSFCTHAIGSDQLFVINDATLDARFQNNPVVTGGLMVRFYAGAPLITREGHRLGTICVVDTKPRQLSPAAGTALEALARQVVSQMELRRSAATNATLCAKATRDARRQAREAHRDSLTGLPNRACMAIHLAASIEATRLEAARAANSDFCSAAVLIVDLDRFKHVNDTLGHCVGDDVLRVVSRVLKSSVRPKSRGGMWRANDVVSRLGGDEFTILLNNLKQPSDAEKVAERIVKALSRPMEFGGHSVQIGTSIGIARIEPRHTNVDEVMREADTALYAAKDTRRGRWLTFDSAMHAAAMRELSIERDLRDLLTGGPRAPSAGGLRIHYQPIVDVSSGATLGFEALARWEHPQLGTIAPSEFIPVAEQTGLIVPLGAWVMTEACAQLAAWSNADDAFSQLSMNINVARLQLIDPTLVTLLKQLLEQHQIAPARIKIEITESTIMYDPEASTEALHGLRALGVELYMDDFGTGHSSLSCLKRFPLSGLKIDRSFITVLAESEESDAIIRAVLELARCFKMKVTAEGVETSEQWWLLRKFGCHQAQGYFFAKPLDAESAEHYVLREVVTRTAVAA